MGAGEKLKRGIKLMMYRRRFGAVWAQPLIDNGVWPLLGASVDGQGRLVTPELGTPIDSPTKGALLLLRVLPVVKRLRTNAKAEFDIQNDSVTVRIGRVTVEAESSDDLAVIGEVFGEEIYRYEIDGNALVLDVGANIGASALFFAQKPDTEVWAYELAPSTAECAQRNIDRNPQLAGRIRLHACGLSDGDKELDIAVDPDHRPSITLYRPIVGEAKTSERAKVCDAASVFREAAESLGERRLVAKIDAEGAEYEIFDRLAQAGLLPKIDLLMLEWHERDGKDPDAIRKLLKEAGFSWVERLHLEAPVGFIAAYQPKRSD